MTESKYVPQYNSRMLGEGGIVPAAGEDVLAKVNALREAIGAGPLE